MFEPLQLPFFFIIGRPRSGTTLIRTLLDAHPNVIVPPEYPVIPDLFNRLGAYPHWNASNKAKLLETFKKPQTFNFWNYEYLRIDEQTLSLDITKLQGCIPLHKVLKLFYYHSQSVFPKQELQLLGDKNPVYALYTPRLMKWFPDAKFLFITRDYRDNFLSMRKFEWEAPHPVLQAWRWKYITRMMLKLKEAYPTRILMFRYEDLVTHPEEKLQQICTFLEIPFIPAMLNFHKKAGDGFSFIDRETLLKYHESLIQPINTSSIGRWKEKLTSREIQLMDVTVGEYAGKAGYLREFHHFPLRIQMIALPMQIYGFILYKLMLLGEYLPYRVKVILSQMLPWLVKVYRKFKP
ncbi:MAG: hypothetical protein PWR20_1520 [Bacteroidales bacterium]|nr:hypothetical protein [Bacteroidales bacterium]MDN5330516.1 hypothetical protein [Bacteroidales bacterium]